MTVYTCEECTERRTGEPAETQKYPGKDGTVILRFCEECTH